jgi:predicted CXXCH cytochrome family protein
MSFWEGGQMKVFQQITLLGLIILGGVSAAWGAADVCFKCHQQKDFTDKRIHAPVARGECTACHNPHVAKHEKLLRSEVVKLCQGCHGDLAAGTNTLMTHKPVREGNCLACHEPHSSSLKGLLKKKNQIELCFSCHEGLTRKFEVNHVPFTEGQCNACHFPHNSPRALLLVEEPDTLCRSCHEKISSKAHKNFPGKAAACLTCHNPHGSTRRALVKDFLHAPYAEGCDDCHADGKPGTEKCFECHDEVRNQTMAVRNHLGTGGNNSCTNCHSPHAADNEQLLRSREEYVCRNCHGDTVANYVDKPYSHPLPGSCSNCHQVHGSNNLAMLNGDGNQVCSSCHETQGKFTHPVGAGTNDPRTGMTVNCVSCHYPHGTDYPKNLKMDDAKDLCVQCHRGY